MAYSITYLDPTHESFQRNYVYGGDLYTPDDAILALQWLAGDSPGHSDALAVVLQGPGWAFHRLMTWTEDMGKPLAEYVFGSI